MTSSSATQHVASRHTIIQASRSAGSEADDVTSGVTHRRQVRSHDTPLDQHLDPGMISLD